MNDYRVKGDESARNTSAPSAPLWNLTGQANVTGRREGVARPEAEVAEVALLLPPGQAAALERAAHRRGLTVGQLIRCLIRDYLAGEARSPPGRG
jgi:hypothetical protein